MRYQAYEVDLEKLTAERRDGFDVLGDAVSWVYRSKPGPAPKHTYVQLVYEGDRFCAASGGKTQSDIQTAQEAVEEMLRAAPL